MIVGTIFEETRLPLPIWFQGIALMLNAKSSMSAKEIQRNLGITYKTAYYVCMRIRIGMLMPETKLNGIIEMDESYFPGKPKYNRGRRLGDGAWEYDDKWMFGMAERGSLDAVAVQVPSNRSRLSLLPIIDDNCNVGTIFCSDGWKAYNKLAEHLELDDVLHYPVNHSENYVDPDTGAHTQTIEGFWRQVKAWLPLFGLKPKDLPTYMATFLWYRYCKQHKIDQFIHLLKCMSEKRPLVTEFLPNGTMQSVEEVGQELGAHGKTMTDAICIDGDNIV